MINSTEGPGVARYSASDGRTGADIYVGLKLDGFKRYQDISSVYPNIKMQFDTPPVILCRFDLTFNADNDTVITIQVVDVPVFYV